MINHPIPAIYENGTLRPLVALDSLPEQTQVQIIIMPLPTNLAEPGSSAIMALEEKSSISEWFAQLREINKQSPIDFEIPPREDRPNPLLEKPDDFFV